MDAARMERFHTDLVAAIGSVEAAGLTKDELCHLLLTYLLILGEEAWGAPRLARALLGHGAILAERVPDLLAYRTVN